MFSTEQHTPRRLPVKALALNLAAVRKETSYIKPKYKANFEVPKEDRMVKIGGSSAGFRYFKLNQEYFAKTPSCIDIFEAGKTLTYDSKSTKGFTNGANRYIDHLESYSRRGIHTPKATVRLIKSENISSRQASEFRAIGYEVENGTVVPHIITKSVKFAQMKDFSIGFNPYNGKLPSIEDFINNIIDNKSSSKDKSLFLKRIFFKNKRVCRAELFLQKMLSLFSVAIEQQECDFIRPNDKKTIFSDNFGIRLDTQGNVLNSIQFVVIDGLKRHEAGLDYLKIVHEHLKLLLKNEQIAR